MIATADVQKISGPIKIARKKLRSCLLATPAATDSAPVPAMSSANGLADVPAVAKKISLVAMHANRPLTAASISKPCAACRRLKKGMVMGGQEFEA